MNLPNLLTMSRIFLAVILWFFCGQASPEGAFFAIVIFALASLTDLLDGILARKYNLISSFGKIMDPIADKVLVLTAMFIFASEQILSWWMVILIATREILVTASRIYLLTEGKVIPAERAGKLKTIFQVTTISFVLLYRFFWLLPLTQDWMRTNNLILLKGIDVLMIATLVIALSSGWVYFSSLKKD